MSTDFETEHRVDLICGKINTIGINGSDAEHERLTDIFHDGFKAIANQTMQSGVLVKDTNAYRALRIVGDIPEGSADERELEVIPDFKDVMNIYQMCVIARDFPKDKNERLEAYTERVIGELDKFSHRMPMVNARRDGDPSLPNRRSILRGGLIGSLVAASAASGGNTIYQMLKTMDKVKNRNIPLANHFKEVFVHAMHFSEEQLMIGFLTNSASKKLRNLELRDVEAHPEYQKYLDQIFKDLPEIFDKLALKMEPEVAALHSEMSVQAEATTHRLL